MTEHVQFIALSHDDATAAVEQFIREFVLTQGYDPRTKVSVVTWGADDGFRPWGVRVSELSFSVKGGPDDKFGYAGASFMQSEGGEHLAICAAVERLMLSLMHGAVADDRESDEHLLRELLTEQPRNLARFGTDDAEAVIGRPLTAHEERTIVKALGHSSMGEVFSEVVSSVVEDTATQEARAGDVDFEAGLAYREPGDDWHVVREVNNHGDSILITTTNGLELTLDRDTVIETLNEELNQQ